MAANRERRSGAGKRNFSMSALESLRAVREGKGSRAHQIQFEDPGDVYEELDEAAYQNLVRARRQELESFVEDDGDGEGYIDDGEEHWEDMDEETRKKRSISRVNMPRRQGNKGAIMPHSDHVASVFLGGKAIKPGQFNSHGVLLDELEEDTLKHFTSELGEEATEEDRLENERRKRQRLMDVAMFGQTSELQEQLNQVLEGAIQEGEGLEANSTLARLQRQTGMSAKQLADALHSGSTARNHRLSTVVGADPALLKEFAKPLPRLTLDDEGNLAMEDDPMAGGLDDDLIGDYDTQGADGNFGIDASMPVNDPTFTAQAKSASASGARTKGVLPPTIKEVSFATGEGGTDWFKLSSTGVPQIKLDRSKVILSRPAEGMERQSPVYQVKVEVAANSATDGASADTPEMRSEVYDELTMFWYDAAEQDGYIFLFGKALLPDRKSTTSVCVRVAGMERNLFVLPRSFKVEDEDDELATVTDEPVQLIDIHTEVKSALNSIGVSKFKSKMVKREYCFDRELPDYDAIATQANGKSSLLDTDEGVPRATSYLKVLYPFTAPALPRNMKGKTFSRIFGTKSTALELFLLKRNLMGPCWLTIKHVEPLAKGSWAKFNFATSNPKHVSVLEDAPNAPLFSVLSLSIKTVLNEQSNRHEVVMASYMLHDHVNVDGPTLNENDFTYGSIVAKLPQHQLNKKEAGVMGPDAALTALPIDFEVKANQINRSQQQQQQRKGESPSSASSMPKLQVVPNERALLSLLLARLHTLDPDVIVGHDLHGFGVDVLLSRMSKNNLGLNWSKFGRLIKSKMPVASGKGDDSFSLVDRGVGSGRLILDTMVCSKEFLSAQKMYTLSFLAETQLKVKHEEIDASMVPFAYKDTNSLLQLVKANENDSFLQLQLMFKLVMLPLSKQLTNLCGNMWARSLRAARAERVEFLLLHDFHRHKFLIPEKYTSKERREKEARREEEEKKKLGPNPDPAKVKAMRASRNKPQYAGGLVLEPKRGFYDRYVLLLDFNSLYPSIIQEFNICFTTVKHWQITAPGDMAAPPPPGSESGHLPKVIRRLVQRRRNVKDMLKKEADKAKQQELDIRQKALKLVANAMYGCLGFVSSRFYCEPLAALITSQGREILQSSVELTNSLNANVIYGDTDSIMVYSNETDLGRALELGRKIKSEINKRHKVLEIDIDGVFKNMLLLRKKKYAALKIIEQPDGTRTAQREVKGLDLVRRDWCPLSKEIGFKVLGEVLSGLPREEVVERIHAHLMALRDALKNNQVSLDKFIITKGLTKNPKEYTDAKNMPHVKVALDLLAKGKSCKQGDFIPYVICKNSAATDSQLATRAFDPAYVVSMQGGLEIDVKWYLSNQILPPVARLIGPIEETDAGKVAYALGLDPKAFHNFGSKDEKAVADEDDDSMLLSTHAQDDEEKFKQASPLLVQCHHCAVKFQFPGVFHKVEQEAVVYKNEQGEVAKLDGSAMQESKEGENTTVKTEGGAAAASASADKKDSLGLHSGGLLRVLSGLKCPNALTSGCPGLLASPDESSSVLTQFTNRLTSEIRLQTQKYYSGFYKCNDSSCGRRTRDLSVAGDKCMAYGCKGRMEREYPASQLYLQLQYFRSLFDMERAIEAIAAENQRRKADPRGTLPQLQAAVPSAHANIYKQLHSYMVSVLRQSAYYWLPPSIFDTKISAKR